MWRRPWPPSAGPAGRADRRRDMRLVLDTNVLVSAIVFGGPPRDVVETVLTGAHRLVLSPAILRELRRVLTGSKFRFPAALANHIEAEIREIAEIVEPDIRLSVITTDPEDNRVLECAVEGGAHVIVSGDRDLLALGRYAGIPVFRPQEFLAGNR